MDYINFTDFMDYIYILGVKVHKIKKKDILKNIELWLDGEEFHYITTVNPEFTLAAGDDEEFKDILNNSDLAIPDGIGLKFAAWLFGKNIYRTTGADLTSDILKLAEQKNCSLYFFVWKHGLSSADEIIKKLEIFARGGSAFGGSNWKLGRQNVRYNCQIDGQAIEKDGRDIDWDKFNEFNPDILLVGLGAPHQEKLIARLRENACRPHLQGCLPSLTVLRRGVGGGFNKKVGIKLAMGVGGTFDFLCGKIKRAPKIMRLFGFEWLWRLMQQPKKHRVKRISNAVIVFPWRVFVWKLHAVFSKN